MVSYNAEPTMHPHPPPHSEPWLMVMAVFADKISAPKIKETNFNLNQPNPHWWESVLELLKVLEPQLCHNLHHALRDWLIYLLPPKIIFCIRSSQVENNLKTNTANSSKYRTVRLDADASINDNFREGIKSSHLVKTTKNLN